jgi:hypothetical protein
MAIDANEFVGYVSHCTNVGMLRSLRRAIDDQLMILGHRPHAPEAYESGARPKPAHMPPLKELPPLPGPVPEKAKTVLPRGGFNLPQPRRERAQQIVADQGVTWVAQTVARVASQTVEGETYQVEVNGDAWTCTCKDFHFRQEACKHVLAAQDTRSVAAQQTEMANAAPSWLFEPEPSPA